MEPVGSSVSSVSSDVDHSSRAVWRALAGALLILGGVVTIGSLWMPWHHYLAPAGTSYLSLQDATPYIPITVGWRHSYLVFTALALITGALAWLTPVWEGGQPSKVFALSSVLFACMGAVFASLGVDGAEVWRSSEATDIGLYVCLVGYAALIAAGATMMAKSASVSAARVTQT
jgi:hypothetical protein